MTDQRVLIVSNRLPVTLRTTPAGVTVAPSCGGLATGLGSWHARANAVWVGWPGDVFPGAEQRSVDDSLRSRRIVPVHLSRDQVDRSYDGFANRVLWPLLHYLVDRLPTDPAGWDAYVDVNNVFADVVAREYRPDDIIWVHDYQLMLLPRLIRNRLPHARIGFFLHVPFPASEVFRTLPRRRDVLQGLLGADLIGFHTFAYMRHFMTSLLHVDGVEADVDRIRVDGREVEVGVFPMGVDAAAFASLAGDPDVRARVAVIRQQAAGRRLVLGVDRLDYTKGIPRRLEAIERLLARDVNVRHQIRYVQVAVPSRTGIDSYESFRRDVEERIGHINGTFGTVGSMPIHYVRDAVPLRELVALYGAADVMLVTPLRDGMNLVGKEFAASRIDDDGVLVLSEFAGAAAELNGAVVVNPYDLDGVASSIQRALDMSADERRVRMRNLRRRVLDCDVQTWVRAFLQQLETRDRPSRTVTFGRAPSLRAAIGAANTRNGIRLLLDYDGTLVPLARSPELAAPDDELLRLLSDVVATAGIRVDIVSGRPHDTLERWLGELPLTLWAEHGFWHRAEPGMEWQSAATIAPDWIARIAPILHQFVASTPGSRLEIKSASVAWHYRGVARDFGARQAHELRMLLGDILSNQPLEVLEGKKVIEVRLRGVDKGMVAHRVLAECDRDTLIVAIGDDRTDEDLFRALPPPHLTAAVGRSSTAAAFRLEDHRAVRRLLGWLVDEARLVETRRHESAVWDRALA